MGQSPPFDYLIVWLSHPVISPACWPPLPLGFWKMRASLGIIIPVLSISMVKKNTKRSWIARHKMLQCFFHDINPVSEYFFLWFAIFRNVVSMSPWFFIRNHCNGMISDCGMVQHNHCWYAGVVIATFIQNFKQSTSYVDIDVIGWYWLLILLMQL